MLGREVVVVLEGVVDLVVVVVFEGVDVLVLLGVEMGLAVVVVEGLAVPVETLGVDVGREGVVVVDDGRDGVVVFMGRTVGVAGRTVPWGVAGRTVGVDGVADGLDTPWFGVEGRATP